MQRNTWILMASAILAAGCTLGAEGDEVDEIVDNLIEAGYPEEDIQIIEDQVYVGNDAHVTLEASREMVEGHDDVLIDLDTIQYRTRNLVSRNIKTICIHDVMGSSVLSEGLRRAINRYNNLGLTFRFKKGVVGCDAQITAKWYFGSPGGFAGFPSRGKPFDTINIARATADRGPAIASHVIAHELGHAVGMRHSDFYNRSISCGQGGNEGDGGVGAIHIPGTPQNATFNGSLMNSCFNDGSTGVFTGSDKKALRHVY